jgi:hypothetical protein
MKIIFKICQILIGVLTPLALFVLTYQPLLEKCKPGFVCPKYVLIFYSIYIWALILVYIMNLILVAAEDITRNDHLFISIIVTKLIDNITIMITCIGFVVVLWLLDRKYESILMISGVVSNYLIITTRISYNKKFKQEIEKKISKIK